MNTDLNAEKSCEEKSICRNNSASLYPPPRPPRHRRGLSSGGYAVEKELRRSGNHARLLTGSLQEGLPRLDSHCQDQYYFLRSDIMNSNNNTNQFNGNQLSEVRRDEYGSVKVPLRKRISFGSCKYIFIVVLVNLAVIVCIVILIQLFSDWRGGGDVDFHKSLRFGGFADRVMREAKFGSVADVLYLKNTEP